MEKRSRLLIYERKEVILLGSLAVLVAVFAFTFGIHLGKRVPPKPKADTSANGSDPAHVNQFSDLSPSRSEAEEKVSAANEAVGEIVDQTLKEEVAGSGIQVDKPIQVELPEHSKNEAKHAAGAEHGAKAPHAKASEHAEKAPAHGGHADAEKTEQEHVDSALTRAAPAGVFALQISAVPASDHVGLQKIINAFSKVGLEVWVRSVDIPGKGKWYRVYEGGFASKEDAEQAGKKLKSAGKVAGFVVTRVSGEAQKGEGTQHE